MIAYYNDPEDWLDAWPINSLDPLLGLSITHVLSVADTGDSVTVHLYATYIVNQMQHIYHATCDTVPLEEIGSLWRQEPLPLEAYHHTHLWERIALHLAALITPDRFYEEIC